MKLAPVLFGDLHQLCGLLDVHGHGLFDQGRQAETQQLLADGVMRLRRGGDHIAVIAVSDGLVEIGISRHAVFFLKLRQTCGVHIHHRAEIAHLMQGADVVFAPASAADDTDFLFHSLSPYVKQMIERLYVQSAAFSRLR